MVKRNFKYQSGEGNQYYTRKAAMRKLQLSMKDFRRLCILKGIYPREPKHRAIAQRGSTDIRVLYHKKDIRFLLHEPIVWTLRDRKIFNRRIASAKGKGDKRKKDMRMSNYPEIKLDHIIKERYPSFIDAIKDMDDCLTLLFLFSTFPALKTVTRDLTSLSRRLTIEWMHYCIAAKALRKVFVSIKGYYFQAEVKGQMVTWIVPHYYPFQPPKKQDIDLTIMRCFADFYSTLCGFVNFRLYNTINLVYPPQFTVSVDSEDSQKSEEVFVSERIAALNADLLKTDQDQANEEEEIDLELLQTDKDSEKVQQMREEAAKLKRLKTLFKGLKFFINREVPREPLVFIIRSFGGKVSWDKTLFVGATFDESDETITHQIADRPTITNKYISRDYIQPQWVFDSVNQCKLLPTNQYFVGEILPPHLSPFVSAKEEGQYAPPEELALTNPMILQRKVNKSKNEGISDDEEEEHEDEEMENNQGQLDYALAKAFMEERDEGNDDMKVSDSDNDAEDYQKDGNNEVTKKQKEGKKKKMVVKAGQIYKENPKEAKQLTKQEEALRAKMVKSRHRKLYRKLVDERKTKEKEANKLKMKRQQIDKQGLKQVKAQRKDERKKILKDN